MRANTVCAILGVFICMASATAMGGTLAGDPNALVWDSQTWRGSESLAGQRGLMPWPLENVRP